MNQKYDEATNTNTFYLIKTDCDTATQQKLAEIELQGGETCGMAAWDDMVELYCFENMDKGNPTEWCYIVDTSACLWKRNSTLHGMMMPRCTSWTMPAASASSGGTAPRTR